MEFRAQLAIVLVIVGCMSNVIFLELMINEDPGSGNLITFSQFCVIAIEGLVFTTKFLTVTPKVPFTSWITLVIMFFLVSVSNNYALNFNIPMPLHMIFRAGSLIANMMMGIILLGKRYSTTKYMSVLMITAGILVCTVMSAKSPQSDPQEGDSLWLALGIFLLTFALFLSARMGIYQEVSSQSQLSLTSNVSFPGYLWPVRQTPEGGSVLHSRPPSARLPAAGSRHSPPLEHSPL